MDDAPQPGHSSEPPAIPADIATTAREAIPEVAAMSRGSANTFAIDCYEPESHVSVVAVTGDLDLHSAATLKRRLLDLLADGRRHLIIDVTHVTFVDSTTLGVLISLKAKLPPSGRMTIAGDNPAFTSLLRMTGLTDAFEFQPTAPPPAPQERLIADGRIQRDPIDIATNPGTGGSPGATTPDHTPPAETGDLPLTRDATLVLGLVGTALPFTRSRHEQAIRWLRALRRHGSAGIALAASGIRADPITPPDAADAPTEPSADPDPVGGILSRASRIAGDRRDREVHTTDILAAVMTVYRPELEPLFVVDDVSYGEAVEQLRVVRHAAD
jgi:anti-sigma B factor antagonist